MSAGWSWRSARLLCLHAARLGKDLSDLLIDMIHDSKVTLRIADATPGAMPHDLPTERSLESIGRSVILKEMEP